MGETSAQVEREIEHLRTDTTWIVDELETRARGLFDIRSQASNHPYVFGSIVGSLAATCAAIGYLIYRRRQRPEPVTRARSALHKFQHEVLERVDDANREMRSMGMMKRVLWSMFAAGTVALAGIMAKRFSAQLWEAALHERPPEKVR